jgi:hypothetical protein
VMRLMEPSILKSQGCLVERLQMLVLVDKSEKYHSPCPLDGAQVEQMLDMRCGK